MQQLSQKEIYSVAGAATIQGESQLKEALQSAREWGCTISLDQPSSHPVYPLISFNGSLYSTDTVAGFCNVNDKGCETKYRLYCDMTDKVEALVASLNTVPRR